MAQNFFGTYEDRLTQRKKAQGANVAGLEPMPELEPSTMRGLRKQGLKREPQFQSQSPLAGGALEAYQTAFDPVMAPLTGQSKLMSTPTGEFGGLDQWTKQIGQGARTATGAVDALAPTANYVLHGASPTTERPMLPETSHDETPAPTMATGGGASMVRPTMPASSHTISTDPTTGRAIPPGGIGLQGTPGWGPKQTPQQAQAFYDKAVGSSPQQPDRTSMFEPPAPEAPMDARSMGLGPLQQEAFNQIAQGNSAHATEAAYNRWLQMQGLGQAQQKQRMDMATGESGLEDAALRRSVLQREATGNTPGQQLERSKAATEMLRYMPTMVQDATGKMVPNPERAQLEKIALEGLGGTTPTAAPATTAPTPGQADESQPTSFWDKAHAFGRQAVPAGLAAATPGALAKMGVKSAGKGVLGPLAYGGLAYSGLNMLADALDPEGTKAVGRNPKSGFAGAVAGGVGGYKFGPRPGVATPTEAGPSATSALGSPTAQAQRPAGWEYETPRQPGWEYEGSAMSPAAAPTSSTMSGTKAPVSEAGQQGIRALKPGEPLPGTALRASDATMRQKFRDAPAMEAEPVVYTPEDQQAIETVRAGMGDALHRGDMDTFQRLWVQMEALHNKYKGASPSPLH